MKFRGLRLVFVLSMLLVAALAVPAIAADRGEARGDSHGKKVRFQRVELRLVAVELRDLFTVVLPDGTTFTGEDAENGEDEEFDPPVGTKFYLTEDLYAPAEDDPNEPAGDPIGRTQITCEFLVREDLRCFVDARVEGQGQLHHTTVFNFEDIEEEFRLEAAITGGSGAYAGATGQTIITEREDFEESGVGFYDVQAILPK